MERVDRVYYLNNPDVVGVVEKMTAAEFSGIPEHHREFMNRYDLTPAEAQHWSAYAWRTWQMHQADYLYGNTDRLEEDILAALDTPGLALYLEVTPVSFDEDFVDYVNELRVTND